jgi:short subunit dehydrogenase-like uncharacterized protein
MVLYVDCCLNGHLCTVMIAECALCLLPSLNQASRHRLPALAKEGGILTPVSALGEVLIERMEATGKFQFESWVLDPKDKKSR